MRSVRQDPCSTKVLVHTSGTGYMQVILAKAWMSNLGSEAPPAGLRHRWRLVAQSVSWKCAELIIWPALNASDDEQRQWGPCWPCFQDDVADILVCFLKGSMY